VVRRSGKRRHHHPLSGHKIRKEKGASPPNSRSEDQDREGSITPKSQVKRSGKRREHHHQISGYKVSIGEGASPPNFR
tara:strand:- start:946 stop:1179 length:234 start_codon:yes stop_codon:yes gene_type:complete